MTHSLTFNQERWRKWQTDGTPISIHDLVACAASTSALEGEAKTCMKKLDEARTAVDTMFRRRCSVMLSFAAELQQPLQNTRLPFMEPLMVAAAIENAVKSAAKKPPSMVLITAALRHPDWGSCRVIFRAILRIVLGIGMRNLKLNRGRNRMVMSTQREIRSRATTI